MTDDIIATQMFQNNIGAVYECECGERMYFSKDIGLKAVHPCKDLNPPLCAISELIEPFPDMASTVRIANRVWP